MPMNNLYETKTFDDIFQDENTFSSEAIFEKYDCGLTEANLKQIYWLLSARFGNNPIANRTETQFKQKVGMTMFQYAPTWLKKLEIQQSLRDLTEEDIRTGAETLYRHAFNPETIPSDEELPFVNDQNKTSYKKNKVEAYASLWSMLENDVTKYFLDKFQPLFKNSIIPAHYIYVSEEEEEE